VHGCTRGLMGYKFGAPDYARELLHAGPPDWASCFCASGKSLRRSRAQKDYFDAVKELYRAEVKHAR
jgi:hypothetical protein